ncbi:SCO2400 family protein [Streptomyces mirabilis]|uniref:SCO2400 family protein n=1 Tax=Streptomyces mirabilis TaxID=68239 RepID=UPI0036DDD288
MDYCSSCRRHLNGALVCPGCGAYAPDIAPPAADGHSGSARAMTSARPATTTHRDPAASVTGHDSLPDGVAEPSTAKGVAPHVAADIEDLPPARQGRAARRRRLARWRKNKRRAAVASAVAFVGGGLSIAMMDRHATDRAQAATAPDDPRAGAGQEHTPQQNPPAAAPATAQHSHRPSHSPSQPQTPTANAPQQQTLRAPSRTTSPIARPDTTVPARPAATATPQPQSTAPAAGNTTPDRSGTAAQQQPAPATGDGTKPNASQTSPSRASTSPTEVCLLGLCLG